MLRLGSLSGWCRSDRLWLKMLGLDMHLMSTPDLLLVMLSMISGRVRSLVSCILFVPHPLAAGCHISLNPVFVVDKFTLLLPCSGGLATLLILETGEQIKEVPY